MAKLPLLTAKEVIKVLEKLGFTFVHQRGSHIKFTHPDRPRPLIIPNHTGEKIGRGLLIKIIKKELNMSREEFEKYL